MPLYQMILSATIPSHALSDLEDILQVWSGEDHIDVTLILHSDLSDTAVAHLRRLLIRLQERSDAQVRQPLLRELFITRPPEAPAGE